MSTTATTNTTTTEIVRAPLCPAVCINIYSRNFLGRGNREGERRGGGGGEEEEEGMREERRIMGEAYML